MTNNLKTQETRESSAMLAETYKTMDIAEAATFLHMSPSSLREKAKQGIIKGAKPGKKWVFIETDLVDHLRTLYFVPRQALQVTNQEKEICHSSNAILSGGWISPHRVDKEYDALLRRRISD